MPVSSMKHGVEQTKGLEALAVSHCVVPPFLVHVATASTAMQCLAMAIVTSTSLMKKVQSS